MKHRLLGSFSFTLLAALAACGGGHKSTNPPGNGGGGGGGTPAGGDLWAAVMKQGATFTLDNAEGNPDGDVTTVVATVTEVKEVRDARIATIEWSDGHGGESGNGLPHYIAVSPKGVWFGDDAQHPDSSPTFPPGAPPQEVARDGYKNYVHQGTSADIVCFGEEPGDDAGECEDVCFAELCVTAADGLVGGAGTWWPNYEMFGPAHQAKPE